MAEDVAGLTGTVFVSLVCVCESDPDQELAAMSMGLQRHFPLHEIVAVVRNPGPGPTLPNVHLLEVAPPADDRVRQAAALDHALGDVVVIADPSQDDAHAVVQAASLVASGAAAVYETGATATSVRRWVHDSTRRAFARLAAVPLADVAGVRACNREVLSDLLLNSDRDRLLEAFPALTGQEWQALPRRSDAPAVHRPLRWRVSALLAASARPLRFAYGTAVLGAGLNLLYSGYVVVINAVRGHTVEGWTSLSLQLAGMFFLISLILAVLAEYLYQLVKRGRERPLYRLKRDVASPSMPVGDRLNVEHSAGDLP